MSICPHCKENCNEFIVVATELKNPPEKKFTGLEYSCPHCGNVISVSLGTEYFSSGIKPEELADRLNYLEDDLMRGLRVLESMLNKIKTDIKKI